MKKKIDKEPIGTDYFYTTPFGLGHLTFRPQLSTLEILKLYIENYKIIEIIEREYGITTGKIAKRVGLSNKRVLDILEKFKKAGIVKTKKERNINHWFITKTTGRIVKKLFKEMCEVIEKPEYYASEKEISAILELIKSKEDSYRVLGFKHLLRLADIKIVSHDPRVIQTFMEIVKDSSYDKFKDTIIHCFFSILPDPLKDPRKGEKIEEMDSVEIEEYINKLNFEELKKLVEEFYFEEDTVLISHNEEEMKKIAKDNYKQLKKVRENIDSKELLRALERYCFNEPLTTTTIPLALTLMRMVDEERAIKNMLRIIENPPFPFHYQHILLPARGLSSVSQEKLLERIMDLELHHPDETIRRRAHAIHLILIDAL